jgi:chromosome segregation ATPase
MTVLEVASSIAGGISLLLGAGFGGKWVAGRVAVAKARATEKKSEASVAIRAIESADDAREDTQKHVTELVQCERRCARIEALNEALTHRLDALEAKYDRDVDGLKAKVATLEGENVELRARVGVLEEQVRNLIPEAMGNYAATIDRPQNVTPIGRTR